MTHAEVVEVVGPILELLVGAARHAEVGGDVLHGGVGRHTDTQNDRKLNFTIYSSTRPSLRVSVLRQRRLLTWSQEV